MIKHAVYYYKNGGTFLCAVPDGPIPAVGASVYALDTDGTTVLNKTVATVVYDVQAAYRASTDKTPFPLGTTIVKVTLSA